MKTPAGSDGKEFIDLKVRGLFVDNRLREFVSGTLHEVTERLFVVRRAVRINDLLPGESAVTPRWQWEQGGWLLVDRTTGKISAVTLADFEPLLSAGLWYRDYFAYCGVSDDGKKTSVIVFQLGRRKLVLKRPLGEIKVDSAPEAACKPPVWQRQPVRVTFVPNEGEGTTYAIRGHSADIVNEPDDENE